jgi:hypothetical protein
MNTKSLLTKVAVPVLGLGLLGGSALALAGPASASTGPTGSVTISTQAQADAIMAAGQPINSNVDIPAGANLQLRYVDVKGNLSVEGHLSAASDTFERNVGVNGGSLWLFNGGSHILGNLSVTNSAGDDSSTALGDNTSDPSTVSGNFAFTANTGRLYVDSQLTVHNFTFAGNTGPASDYSGLVVTGTSSIS